MNLIPAINQLFIYFFFTPKTNINEDAQGADIIISKQLVSSYILKP